MHVLKHAPVTESKYLSDVQIVLLQSVPENPGRQLQIPRVQIPFLEHQFGHIFREVMQN